MGMKKVIFDHNNFVRSGHVSIHEILQKTLEWPEQKSNRFQKSVFSYMLTMRGYFENSLLM